MAEWMDIQMVAGQRKDGPLQCLKEYSTKILPNDSNQIKSNPFIKKYQSICVQTTKHSITTVWLSSIKGTQNGQVLLAREPPVTIYSRRIADIFEQLLDYS